MIVALTQDLMMSSSVSVVARAKGIPFKSTASMEKAIALIQENPVSSLLIDLQMPNLDLARWVEQFNALNLAQSPKVIAYAQHGEIGLLKSARELGIDHVLTRGQTAKGLEEIL